MSTALSLFPSAAAGEGRARRHSIIIIVYKSVSCARAQEILVLRNVNLRGMTGSVKAILPVSIIRQAETRRELIIMLRDHTLPAYVEVPYPKVGIVRYEIDWIVHPDLKAQYLSWW